MINILCNPRGIAIYFLAVENVISCTFVIQLFFCERENTNTPKYYTILYLQYDMYLQV